MANIGEDQLYDLWEKGASQAAKPGDRLRWSLLAHLFDAGYTAEDVQGQAFDLGEDLIGLSHTIADAHGLRRLG